MTLWALPSASINSTVSLLSGGYTSATSPLTWYFNHETNVFSSGPSLLQGRNGHGSATVVDKVTKEKIPMVTGGYGNSGRLDSTELLINGEWQLGTSLLDTIQFAKFPKFLSNHLSVFHFYSYLTCKASCPTGVCLMCHSHLPVWIEIDCWKSKLLFSTAIVRLNTGVRSYYESQS